MAARKSRDLRVDLASTWSRLSVAPGYFDDCSSCSASISRAELDGRHGREIILKLVRSLDFVRYMIFSSRAHRWKLVGYVDHDFNKYELSMHRIERAFGMPWLVVRGQEGSGTGYALYCETWYQVKEKGLRPVLSYPVEGHTYPWPTGVGQDFRARPRIKSNKIWIRYTVKYTTLDYIKNEYTELFANYHDIFYRWKPREESFVLAGNMSRIIENDVDIIAGIQTGEESQLGTKIGGTTFYSQPEEEKLQCAPSEVFLKYNSRRLMRIAKGTNSSQKQWLKEFLTGCKDSLDRKALQQALQK